MIMMHCEQESIKEHIMVTERLSHSACCVYVEMGDARMHDLIDAFSDYDVDSVVSTSVLLLGLRRC